MSAHTIRYYEKLGLMDGTIQRDSENNYRSFTGEAVERISIIRLGKLVGFSLREIKELLRTHSDEGLSTADQIKLYSGKLAELESRIVDLEAMCQLLRDKIMLFESGIFSSEDEPEVDTTQQDVASMLND
ncbi:MAG: MerR family DNA-binding protein [Chloroflexota bacterium]